MNRRVTHFLPLYSIFQPSLITVQSQYKEILNTNLTLL